MFAVIILVIVIFVLTVTIGNINYIHFYDRSPEFSLLQAIGYEKKYIIGRIFVEMSIILFGGFIIGAALSLAGGYLFNLLYCYPIGTPVTIVSKGYFLITFTIPIFVTTFSLLPMLKFLNKMDCIQVLEGK
jgi:Predicted permease.